MRRVYQAIIALGIPLSLYNGIQTFRGNMENSNVAVGFLWMLLTLDFAIAMIEELNKKSLDAEELHNTKED